MSNQERIFHEFEYLSKQVRRLGYIVQNEGMTVEHAELLNWSDEVNEIASKLSSLKEDVIRLYQN